MDIWAIGPTVMRAHPGGGRHYIHDDPVLHRVSIERIGGIGEPNAGEFLVETPCGYRGWIKQLNKNPDRCLTCEACLNDAPSRWARWPIPEGAEPVETSRDQFHTSSCEDERPAC